MDLTTMHSLFEHEMKDLYSAEKQSIEALRKMVDAASSPELQSTLREYLAVTDYLERLQAAMRQLQVDSYNVLSIEKAGLLGEGRQIARAEGYQSVKDAALTPAAQQVEHCEIAA